MGPWRLTMALGAMAALVAPMAGCASTTSTHPPAAVSAPPAAASTPAAPTARFSAMGLSFRYPVSWRSITPRAGLSDFPALIVYLSTSRLTSPCVTSVSAGRTADTCAYPVRVLPRGGVLARWNANGSPAWHMPQANTTVAGRRALETRTAGGWCKVLGATETITVMIPRSVPGNWYQMDACLRAPGLPKLEAEIKSMLNSVHISPGSLAWLSQRPTAAP
jgi:hypothetical protein